MTSASPARSSTENAARLKPTAGGSLSSITTSVTAGAPILTPPLAPESLTRKDSSASTSSSSRIGTTMVPLRLPAGMRRPPDRPS